MTDMAWISVGNSAGHGPSRLRTNVLGADVVADEFLGAQPEVQLTTRGTPLLLPQEIGAFLDVRLGGLEMIGFDAAWFHGTARL
jgi:hypothetical protein